MLDLRYYSKRGALVLVLLVLGALACIAARQVLQNVNTFGELMDVQNVDANGVPQN